MVAQLCLQPRQIASAYDIAELGQSPAKRGMWEGRLCADSCNPGRDIPLGSANGTLSARACRKTSHLGDVSSSASPPQSDPLNFPQLLMQDFMGHLLSLERVLNNGQPYTSPTAMTAVD